ncbi:hypothetical protein XELAEV_18020514mg [Xenopus laevis]|uniref:Uncharacterized protein n=1 Tax=Xenopus laevis TaxID=8355 RepID=A0A974HQP8_XENLA|nr:hypothetical protein XELAEV_18020514mg [Xenopus laevis]
MRPCDHALFACYLAVGRDLALHCFIVWEHFLSQVLHASIALRSWHCGHCICGPCSSRVLVPLTRLLAAARDLAMCSIPDW